MEVRKKENETTNTLIYRFLKRVQHSGVLREAKKRRFHDRPANRLKRRLSALHRENKKREVEKAKKLGIL
ncbi:MAG: 30S ribosomal protein S21 [Candidatus Harrisonbacteria bacterium]|nr:30S ribosomal protein S21 [Candidatus Harrisonbacteria bacterium]